MKYKLILFIMLFLSIISTLHAKIPQERVAILDSGLDLTDSRFKSKICGYKDFTGEGINDTNGHGTHVVGLIKEYAKNSNYCLIILKFYSDKATGNQNFDRFVLALREAKIQNASIINFSGGGTEYSSTELNTMLDNKYTIYVVAAGNDGSNLDSMNYGYYPASYHLSNMIIVGALNSNNSRAKTSNYGVGLTWELGENILSTLPHGRMGRLSGTSMSTAIHTGKLIKERNQQ